MSKFTLKLITPSNELFSGNVSRVKTKNSLGEFEMLAHHISFITATVPTVTVFEDENGKEHKLFTSTGVLDFSNNQLTFCCDSAELPENIDLERAMKSKERAEQRLKDKKDIDVKRAELALARALTRIGLKNQ